MSSLDSPTTGSVTPDPWHLYALMGRSRLFEELIAELWQAGLISGEMHLSTGEEGIAAGIVSHLHAGDALALDHRGTAAMLMRGVPAWPLLAECLGRPDGLGRGQGGHMHLFAPDFLAASSGIVGAAGPAAAGFALAGQQLRPGSIAVAFFGEGAMNQGMLLESMNLAAAWQLPVLFVCKDDGWAITTAAPTMSGGSLPLRARGLGLDYVAADGWDVSAVWSTARAAIAGLRAGGPPVFLHAPCIHLEGHFLGYQLLRLLRRPVREFPSVLFPLMRAFLTPRGASLRQRLDGMRLVYEVVLATWRDPARRAGYDPVRRLRRQLEQVDPMRMAAMAADLEQEMTRLRAQVSMSEVA